MWELPMRSPGCKLGLMLPSPLASAVVQSEDIQHFCLLGRFSFLHELHADCPPQGWAAQRLEAAALRPLASVRPSFPGAQAPRLCTGR